MQIRWEKQSGNTSEQYIFSSRERALLERGYSEAFIRSVNHIHEDTLMRIAREIYAYVTRDCVRTEHPKVLYIGGQTGSGKSVLERTLRSQVEYELYVPICIDNYRTWHPAYAVIEAEIRKHWAEKMPTPEDSPGNDMADFTHAFASDMSDLLIDLLSKPEKGRYFSICMEWGMRTPEGPLECMEVLYKKGYENNVIFLAVPGVWSLDSCQFRDAFMNSGAHIYRRVPVSFHTISVDTIAHSCGEIYRQGVLDKQLIRHFSLMRRDQQVIFEIGDAGDPEQILQEVLHQTAEHIEPSLMEAQKTYYAESVGLLRTEKWFSYLIQNHTQNYNPERVRVVEYDHKNYVLNYTERTLRYASAYEHRLPENYYRALVRSLQWSEVAKAGSEADREGWIKAGFDLSIHNEASADIYRLEYQEDDPWTQCVAEILIRTHGMMGQMLRGETGCMSLKPLLDLIMDGTVNPEMMSLVLYAQNEAVIKAASRTVWQQVKSRIREMIRIICADKRLPEEMTILERLKALFPHPYHQVNGLDSSEEALYTEILSDKDLWYPQVSLDTFSREEIVGIFTLIRENMCDDIRHISFEHLMHTLYYDYEGKRRINIYKKRIIESYLKDPSDVKESAHVRAQCYCVGQTLFFDIKFTDVCDKLIAFCVEAERSGLIEYQKNIITIFDLFGFRRDIFDRLNNEDKYLDTMNDTQTSRKQEIVDYVQGHSVVDVGSGGGVLLDLLEKRYPDLRVIGTDISANVIENLKTKIEKEGHHYQVIRHNFVDGPLPEKVDNIIFSSILHEIYSYTVYQDQHFCIDSVKLAIQNAVASLNPGGRIIIRDGIMSEEKGDCAIRFKDLEGIQFAQNYLKDFKGLLNLKDENGYWIPSEASLEGDQLTGNINFIREFLYTYTWGVESYSCEIHEQFGYFHIHEFTEFLKSCGLEIIHAETYLEQGYPDHLNTLVELLPGLEWQEMPSSCVIIANLHNF